MNDFYWGVFVVGLFTILISGFVSNKWKELTSKIKSFFYLFILVIVVILAILLYYGNEESARGMRYAGDNTLGKYD